MNMTFPCVHSSMFLFFILLLFTPYSSAQNTRELINHVCMLTDDFNYCKSTFVYNLHKHTTDLRGLVQIALEQTLIAGTEMIRYTMKMMDEDKIYQDFYLICKVRYEMLLDQFEDATLALAMSKYDTLIGDVEKCIKWVQDCQTVLGGFREGINGRSKHNKVLVEMSLVSSHLLKKDSP